MYRRALVAVLAVALMVASGTVLAQSNVTTGEILGTVQDVDGGVLPGVTVVARNVDTGFTRNAVTGGEGSYAFQLMPVGNYQVRAELAGFKPEVRQSIRVSLGTSVRVDFTLQLGNLQEEIVVTGAAPLVETTRPDVASTVSSEQIENLPLNGRDFLDFIALTPMSTTDEDGRAHIGGMRGIQNSFNIDGANSQSNFFGEERGGTRPPFTFSQGARSSRPRTTSSSATRPAVSSTPSPSRAPTRCAARRGTTSATRASSTRTRSAAPPTTSTRSSSAPPSAGRS